MRYLRLSLTLLAIAILAVSTAWAQGTILPQPCSDPIQNDPCAPNLNLAPGQFQATPLIDANCTNGCPDYGDPDHNKVSLYGVYGNDESSFPPGHPARDHYQKGVDLANQITPLCPDGTTANCADSAKAIVFLFIGFSNCTIEVCGGNSDIWDGQDNPPNGHLAGQPCSTPCRNLRYPGGGTAWNRVTRNGWDGVEQQSLLYQVYHPNPIVLVGPHVVIWDGARGNEILSRWDPTPAGYYANHNDCQWGDSHNPECNYNRVQQDLQYNGFYEKQVQAIFIKNSNAHPLCDLKGLYCEPNTIPDAYQSEIYMGNTLRYLKCCTLDANGNSTGLPRYPNLKQVFITSRIYGGYADPPNHGCLMPEPFAYEEGIGVQRMIVAQINQANGGGPAQYAETLNYNVAPWFDWGPYIWASGINQSPGSGLFWCDKTTRGQALCVNNLGDFRYGDDADPATYWGDHTHPTASAAQKVADQLVKFISGQLLPPQSHISDWVLPWKVK